MPAESTAQRRAAGMALAMKRGQLTKPPHKGGPVQKMAKSMSESQLRDFAKKPKKKPGHHGTPMRVFSPRG